MIIPAHVKSIQEYFTSSTAIYAEFCVYDIVLL